MSATQTAGGPRPVDILAIGAHPDDVEISMGGTLARLSALGYGLGVIDLTRGERGSKGDPERRAREAEAASAEYGAAFRLNLDLGDGHVRDDVEVAQGVARLIRLCRPRLVFCHHGEDRHPDHRGAHLLVSRAVFQASLRNLDLGEPHHVVDRLILYPSNEWMPASFVVDVTREWPVKLRAMRAFESQFVEPALEIDRKYFGVSDYVAVAESRARFYGQQIGVEFGEGFHVADSVPVDDPVRVFAGREG